MGEIYEIPMPPEEILTTVRLLDLDLRWHEVSRRWRFYYNDGYFYSVDPNMTPGDWRVHIAAVLDAKRSRST